MGIRPKVHAEDEADRSSEGPLPHRRARAFRALRWLRSPGPLLALLALLLASSLGAIRLAAGPAPTAAGASLVAGVIVLLLSGALGAGILLLHRRLARAEQARDAARRAGQRRLAALGALAHELRTPLSVVIGHADLCVAPTATPARTRASALQIRAAARCVLGIVDDLVECERIASGQVRLRPQELDPVELLGSALDATDSWARARGVEIETDVSPARARFVGDAAAIRRVLEDLLRHALERSPEHGVIRCALRVADGWLEIEAHDGGLPLVPGGDAVVPLADAARASDPGESGAMPGRRMLRGVRALVVLMGGRAQARSSAGDGVTVQVALPSMTTVPAAMASA